MSAQDFRRGFLIIAFLITACSDRKKNNTQPEEIAGNREIADYIKTFEGRGALADSSTLTPPEKALGEFKYPNDLTLELVLSEPEIYQPVNITFDASGRLWVVQYNQYPYPKGLKVLKMDEHLRAQFDKKPQPPPDGVKGADKITCFEDTDNDGKYDKSVDAITGLNIATSVAFGRAKIWVLNPPYLLAYPDPDRNGIPDGPPVVHLDGFGIEDTHAVANSLRWGPDGWLYGAQGSTCTANISSGATKNVHFLGQAIWRYHPETQVFEIFAEGGGNTFSIEIDAKGRIYSGDNGTDRGQYYKQGAYYVKNIGKHGAHTNPFAFGHLANMVLRGEKIRFTHAFVKYEGETLPDRYRGKMIAINPLQNYVQLDRFENHGSTFYTIDEERILETKDKWFRPVDIKAGPDGGIYMADWSDSRLTHIDPRDNWDKKSGRIYALKNKYPTSTLPRFNIRTYSNDQLIKLLSNPNKWFRQQALEQFADRRDSSVVSRLVPLLLGDDDQLALEALWAINLSLGFKDKIAITALHHKDPYVRMWATRLIGDAIVIPGILASELVQLALVENHPEVRSQLAATAKRVQGSVGVDIIGALLSRNVDSDDPDIPLQIWWAIESKVDSNSKEILALFENAGTWDNKVLINIVERRLVERLMIAGGDENFNVCARLFELAPKIKQGRPLIEGLQQALLGRDTIKFSVALSKALVRYQDLYPRELLGIGLRQGDQKATQKVLKTITDTRSSSAERIAYIRIVGEISKPVFIPALLEIIDQPKSEIEVSRAAIAALQRYEDPAIGDNILGVWSKNLKSDPRTRSAALSLFATRPSWALQLLDSVENGRQIGKEEIPAEIIVQIRQLNNAAITKKVDRIWPDNQNLPAVEKNKTLNRISLLLKTGTGDSLKGRDLFVNVCGNCHKLFGPGGSLGPDLTGYDRKNVQDILTNIVDPSAYIREGYVYYNVTTVDGRSLGGQLKVKTSTSTTIQPFGNNPITIANNQIVEIKALNTSLMPERLLDKLSDKEIRDIFAYIMMDKGFDK